MNLARMIEAYRIFEDYPAGRDLFLGFGNCLIRVATNDAIIVDELKAYFRQFISASGPADIVVSIHQAPGFDMAEPFTIKQPDPGKNTIKEEFIDLDDGRVVRKRLTGMIFAFGGGVHIAVGPCRANLNQVVNFINNRYIEWLLCRKALLGHASGVALGSNGLAIAGFSGMGKSTLALGLMARGLTFVSNDRLVISNAADGTVTMHGVAKLPRINPGTVLNNPALAHLIPEQDKKELSGLCLDELWRLERKLDVPIDDCFGPGRFVLSVAMTGLVILNWKPGSGGMSAGRVTDAEHRKRLLAAFIKETGLFFFPGNGCRMPVPSVENYAQLLAATDMWMFSGATDFSRAADFCLVCLQEKDQRGSG